MVVFDLDAVDAAVGLEWRYRDERDERRVPSVYFPSCERVQEVET
jgi:hypothetical protein